MKKILSNTMMALLVFGGSIAFAETGGSGTLPPPRPLQQIKDARIEAKGEIRDIKEKLASTTKDLRGEIKDNIKGKIEDRMEKRIDNRYNRMLTRFQATIDREITIMGKINTRIEKIKANGGNTTEAENYVATAKTMLDKAKADLEILKGLSITQATQENSSTTIKALRDGLMAMRKAGGDVEKDLRDAHKNMEKAVGSLRGVSQLHNASSTREN
ncbi:MAG: hypothetical protein WAX85_01440 [Minisyncoccia bacterium]